MAELSMVEKVAKAMAEADVKTYEARHPNLSRDQIAGAAAVVAGDYLAMARAAIEAMRKPTPQMLAAGWAEITTAKKAAGIARLGPGPGLSDGYRAMIDAALSEEVAG